MLPQMGGVRVDCLRLVTTDHEKNLHCIVGWNTHAAEGAHDVIYILCSHGPDLGRTLSRAQTAFAAADFQLVPVRVFEKHSVVAGAVIHA